MAIRRFVLTLAISALAATAVGLAFDTHRATVLLRNGDRVAGELEDIEAGTVYVRVSLHDQRKLPIGDVALIDFVGGAAGLPETELSVARGSDHLTLLKDGSSLTGRFIDIRGGETGAPADEPHQLYFRVGNDERRVALDRVARLYLGNFPTATAAAAANPTYTTGDPVPPGAIRLPGNVAWMPAGLTVRKGDQVRFTATGRIQLSDDAGDVAHAAGSLRERRAAGAPLPQNFAGALIARVGNSAPFPIGDNTAPITMPADGQLMLGINDDEVSDNKGEFTVTVARTNRR